MKRLRLSGVAQGFFMITVVTSCSKIPFTPVKTLEIEGVIVPREYMVASRERLEWWQTEVGFAVEDFWTPTPDDVNKSEARIRATMFSTTTSLEDVIDSRHSPVGLDYRLDQSRKIVENLASYRRQYVGVIVSGKKRIWLNSFPFSSTIVTSGDWKQDVVMVHDGGYWFWINLARVFTISVMTFPPITE